jgi:hypothetical protein
VPSQGTTFYLASALLLVGLAIASGALRREPVAAAGLPSI